MILVKDYIAILVWLHSLVDSWVIVSQEACGML